MITCINCSEETPLEFNFCIKCENQVKCLECTKQLIKGKSKCLYCGISIKLMDEKKSLNTYSLEEERTKTSAKRKISLSLTDDAIEKIAPVISHLTNPDFQDLIQPATVSKKLKSKGLLQSDKTLPPVSSKIDEIEDATIAKEVEDIFEANSDKLVSKILDFKGKTKKDQQIRFTVMYGWAYPKLMDICISDDAQFKDAVKIAGLLDNNYYGKYLPVILSQYFYKSEGEYKLKNTAKAFVDNIIKDLEDDSISGFKYWEKTFRKKRSSIGKKDKELLEKWIEIKSKGTTFEIRSLENSIDYAIFTIYDITKELKVSGSVKPAVAFKYLSKRYPNVDITAKSFSIALTNSKNFPFFSKTNEGTYFLVTWKK